MYEESYGLREKPFSLVPDPEFMFLSRLHRGALTMLEYGLQEQASFALISGEVGTGKTILVRRFLRTIGDRVAVGVVTSTPRNKSSVLDWILLAFGLDYRGKGPTEQLETFMRFLEAQQARKRRTVLIIDEAQNLGPEALEELRMFANVNVDKDVVLQIVLVGQPEILEILNRQELRQLAQRITLNFKLLPLSFPETRKYIRHRLRVAGGDPDTFSPEAIAVIYLLSGGLPRLINALCDAALVYGFGEGQAVLDGAIVIEVVLDATSGGLAKFPEIDANFDADELLERARELSAEIGPDEDEDLPDETEIRNDPQLPSLEPESGIEPESAAELEPVGGLEDEHRYRKRRNIAAAAFAVLALMSAGLLLKFNLDLSEPVEADYPQSANMDVGKAAPSLPPGPATDGAAGDAANQPETAEPEATEITQSGQPADADPEVTAQPIIEQPAKPAPEPARHKPPSETASAAVSQPVEPVGAAPKLDQSADAPPSETEQPEQQVVAVGTSSDPATVEPDVSQAMEPATDIAQSDQLADDALQKTTEPAIQQPARPAPKTAQQPPSETASAAVSQPVEPVGAAPKLDQSADAPPSETEQPEQQVAVVTTSPSPAPVESEVNTAGLGSAAASNETSARKPETDQAIGEIAAAKPPAPSTVNNATAGAANVGSAETSIALIAPPALKAKGSAKNLPEILKQDDFGQYIDAFQQLFGIWSLDYSSLGGVTPCHKAFAAGLSCYEHGGSLAKLKRLNLPAIVGLKRPTGDLAYAVLTGISGSQVKLRFGDNAVTAPIKEVSGGLSGSFILLWKSPVKFSGDIWEGSHGETVAWLRNSLDEIMPEGFRPGKGTFFNSAVTRAVKEFQKRHGLSADGVVDIETLIGINRALYKNRIPSLAKR
jgi:type II secretory pathway predicted ATPase ExeA